MVTNKDIKLLNEFLTDRGVKYVLTGTAALYCHGALPKDTVVNDIDIIVLTTDEDRDVFRCMFKELEKFSGCRALNSYPTKTCYTFKIGKNNILVNVFEGKAENTNFRIMKFDNFSIKVHDFMDIMKAKLRLRRNKDYDFFFKLFNQISNMFQP